MPFCAKNRERYGLPDSGVRRRRAIVYPTIQLYTFLYLTGAKGQRCFTRQMRIVRLQEINDKKVLTISTVSVVGPYLFMLALDVVFGSMDFKA